MVIVHPTRIAGLVATIQANKQHTFPHELELVGHEVAMLSTQLADCVDLSILSYEEAYLQSYASTHVES
jgi:hypothetical protein